MMDGRSIHWLTDEEARTIFDSNARHHMKMSGSEFLEKWDQGEIDFNGPDHCNIFAVTILFPLVGRE